MDPMQLPPDYAPLGRRGGSAESLAPRLRGGGRTGAWPIGDTPISVRFGDRAAIGDSRDEDLTCDHEEAAAEQDEAGAYAGDEHNPAAAGVEARASPATPTASSGTTGQIALPRQTPARRNATKWRATTIAVQGR